MHLLFSILIAFLLSTLVSAQLLAAEALEVNANGKVTMTETVTLSDSAESTDKDTGALIVEGGVGVEKNMNIGGDLTVAGKINAANAVVAAHAGIPSNTNLSSGVEQIINFSTVEFDTDSAITTGSNWEYQVPDTGIYRVSVQVQINNNGAWSNHELFRTMVFVNGSKKRNFHATYKQRDNGGGRLDSSGSTLLSLTAGDKISIKAYQNSGQNSYLIGASGGVESSFIDIDKL